MGRADFTKIPGGVPGVETRGEVVYSGGRCHAEDQPCDDVPRAGGEPGAALRHVPAQGRCSPRARTPTSSSTIRRPTTSVRAENLLSRAGYTPYEGFVTRGGIEQVWLRGQLMVRGGSVVGECGGKFIPRGKCAL